MKLYVLSTIAALGLLASTSSFAQQSQPPSPSDQQGQQAGQPQAGQQQGLSPRFIKQIQARLRQQGYYDGKATGQWDEDTSDALQNFQEANGLQPTGALDGHTLVVLDLTGPPLLGQPQSAQGQQFGQGQQQYAQGQQSGQQGGRNSQAAGAVSGSSMPPSQTSQGGTQNPYINAYQAGYLEGFVQGLRQGQQPQQSQQRSRQQQ